MVKIWNCRRSSLALVAVFVLAGMGCYLRVDTSGAIAAIVMGVAAANAGENFARKKSE